LTFLTAACILSEWRVIRLPQGDSLTLSIILILLALVFREPKSTPARQAVAALEVIAIGSLVGYGLTHRPPPVRLAFYVGHQILSAALAGVAFVSVSNSFDNWLLTDSFHLPAVIVYVVVLSLSSMLMVSPLNRRILKGDKLPKADLLYTIFLAPIALIVYYFFESRDLSLGSLLILALPLIGVLVTFQLYVNIDTTHGEIKQLYKISREFVAAMSQDETVQRVSASIAAALSELVLGTDACLIYAHNDEANEYILVNKDPSELAPPVIMPNQGLLGRAVLNSAGTIVNDVVLEDALSPVERQWPARTAVIVHPMVAEQRQVGVLVLIRKTKGFNAEEFRLVSIVANQAGGTLHNALMFEQSREMADIDRQLGIFNQAAFTQRSQRAFGRAQMEDKLIAVLLGDIDDFRKVNNTFGHQTGDKVLAGVAKLMKEHVNSSGFVGRWGGEEFVITLPDVDEERAVEMADSIRQAVEQHVFQSDDGREVRATISIGVALFPRDAGDFISLHKQADRAAYLAKKTGKNRVCLYEDRKEVLEAGDEQQPILAGSAIQE
jgi:diguanylate cyclase (GGDEF)-like protein